MISKIDLYKLIKQEDFSKELLAMSKNEIEEILGTECSKMVGFNQNNPHHCYTLFEHCVRTAENIDINNERDLELRVAGLFHDIGKLNVAKEKNGRLVYYGHATESYKIMKDILPLMGFDKGECSYILFVIKHHNDFISYTDDIEKATNSGLVFISKDNVEKYLKKLKQKEQWIDDKNFSIYVSGLLRLCVADEKAQSEYVYMNDKLIDTRECKVRRISMIAQITKAIVLKN